MICACLGQDSVDKKKMPPRTGRQEVPLGKIDKHKLKESHSLMCNI